MQLAPAPVHVFHVYLWWCLLLPLVHQVVGIQTDEELDVILTHTDAEGTPLQGSNKCTVRLHTSLDRLRRRQPYARSPALIDLSGYALHQPLRHAPFDMYVTDIKVRTPSVGDWVRVQKCEYNDKENRMTTQILFNDLVVSGAVRLFSEDVVLNNPFSPPPTESCNMTLRLRRAGLGINAIPMRGRSKGIEMITEAKFMNPNYLSVHAYGCKWSQLFKRTQEKQPEEEEDEDAEFVKLKPWNFTKPEMYGSYRHGRSMEDAEVRIVTLGQSRLPQFEKDKVVDLHERSEENINDYHKDRILGFRPGLTNEKDRLQAVLHVQNAIAQNTNHVFQTHGPFSTNTKPVFAPHHVSSHGHKPISTITELSEDLRPIRPVPYRPFEALFQDQHHEAIVNNPVQHPPPVDSSTDDVSKEMEDVFLRGIKMLLTKYMEKQLEAPLKEALLTNIGYTVSYG